jgi:hypothetical protein
MRPQILLVSRLHAGPVRAPHFTEKRGPVQLQSRNGSAIAQKRYRKSLSRRPRGTSWVSDARVDSPEALDIVRDAARKWIEHALGAEGELKLPTTAEGRDFAIMAVA